MYKSQTSGDVPMSTLGPKGVDCEMDRYKLYQSQTPGDVPTRTLGPKEMDCEKSNINCRWEQNISYKGVETFISRCVLKQ